MIELAMEARKRVERYRAKLKEAERKVQLIEDSCSHTWTVIEDESVEGDVFTKFSGLPYKMAAGRRSKVRKCERCGRYEMAHHRTKQELRLEELRKEVIC